MSITPQEQDKIYEVRRGMLLLMIEDGWFTTEEIIEWSNDEKAKAAINRLAMLPVLCAKLRPDLTRDEFAAILEDHKNLEMAGYFDD